MRKDPIRESFSPLPITKEADKGSGEDGVPSMLTVKRNDLAHHLGDGHVAADLNAILVGLGIEKGLRQVIRIQFGEVYKERFKKIIDLNT